MCTFVVAPTTKSVVVLVYEQFTYMSPTFAWPIPLLLRHDDFAHKPSTFMLCAACCTFKSSSCSASLLLSCILCSEDSICPDLVICNVSHVSTACTVGSLLSASSLSLVSSSPSSPRLADEAVLAASSYSQPDHHDAAMQTFMTQPGGPSRYDLICTLAACTVLAYALLPRYHPRGRVCKNCGNMF